MTATKSQASSEWLTDKQTSDFVIVVVAIISWMNHTVHKWRHQISWANMNAIDKLPYYLAWEESRGNQISLALSTLSLWCLPLLYMGLLSFDACQLCCEAWVSKYVWRSDREVHSVIVDGSQWNSTLFGKSGYNLDLRFSTKTWRARAVEAKDRRKITMKSLPRMKCLLQ